MYISIPLHPNERCKLHPLALTTQQVDDVYSQIFSLLAGKHRIDVICLLADLLRLWSLDQSCTAHPDDTFPLVILWILRVDIHLPPASTLMLCNVLDE